MSIKRKKVAIVGFAETRELAPYNNPEYEIWTVNNLHEVVPRQDRIFQLHKRESWEWLADKPDLTHGTPIDKHVEYLKTCGLPIYCVDKFPEIPTSIRYPIEKMTEEFGVMRTDESSEHRDGYWTNTISMMIALAVYEKFEVIEVYGVNMAVMTEYSAQRPSCEYYLGIARGRGIEVRIPAQTDLLKAQFIYGFEAEKSDAWNKKLDATIRNMQQRKFESDTIIRNQQSVNDKYEGAIAAIHEMEKTWS